MLSVLTFIEFASFDDPRHAREVHALVESLGRSIFFARFEPWQVVNKENDLLTARMGDAPEGDLEFLLRVMEPHARHGVPFNVGVIFDYVAEHAKELRARLEGLKHATLEGVVAIRERVDNEQGFDGVIRRSISEADRPRATLALARAMVDFLQSDRARPLNINDAADLLHTVVPVAYCDFVVLDRKWRTMAEQARRRLDSNGVEAQTAKVFDAGPKGIEHFLTSLEQFQR
jgi:hypothetical protein